MYNIKLNLFIYKSFNNSILIILIIILNLIQSIIIRNIIKLYFINNTYIVNVKQANLKIVIRRYILIYINLHISFILKDTLIKYFSIYN